ncbi:recombinase family protein [Ollibium composti]|uniref:Recombinase family protein n=1 Tax=Ollibium composti TaxID=2675109 RepID=A0ABY2QA47_9HYPH|nr:recombinase family protein [Mesorhizobium composti]THF58857.1 recombinase family protein [Mesorhizobium composti]
MTDTHNTDRPRAYSYVRFSTPEQAKGDSFRRQTEAAARYAATHGLMLDDKFSFHDLGMSAFQGRNKAEGMLGEFLSFVRSGDIAKGSYLLVENLDRVSRENALDALDTLKDIAKAGITVVTLNDGREYTHESLRRNPIDLMVAVMMFMRANEESETKARRLKEAWAAKRTKAMSEGRPMTRLCPGWLRLREDKSGYDPIGEREAIVRQVFAWTLEGKGQHWIADTLNREGVPVFGRGVMWHRSYIKKMLADPSTVGRYTPHRKVNGRRIPETPVEGYFPAVVDMAVWERVQALGSGRSSSTADALQNILAGLASCPLCGATMTRMNKGKRSRPSFVCVRAKGGLCRPYKSVPVEDVQDAIQGNAYRFDVELPSADAELEVERSRLQAAIGGIEDAIDKIVEAVGRAGHSQALLDRLALLEADKDNHNDQLDQVEREIAAALTHRTQNTVGRLVEALEADDVGTANVQLRSLFNTTVVDWRSGNLTFHWRHVPDETIEVMFAWPAEDTAE